MSSGDHPGPVQARHPALPEALHRPRGLRPPHPGGSRSSACLPEIGAICDGRLKDQLTSSRTGFVRSRPTPPPACSSRYRRPRRGPGLATGARRRTRCAGPLRRSRNFRYRVTLSTTSCSMRPSSRSTRPPATHGSASWSAARSTAARSSRSAGGAHAEPLADAAGRDSRRPRADRGQARRARRGGRPRRAGAGLASQVRHHPRPRGRARQAAAARLRRRLGDQGLPRAVLGGPPPVAGDGVISSASRLRFAALAVLWGSGFLWVKIALRGLSPPQIVLAQLVTAAAVLLPVAALGGHALPRTRAPWLHLSVMAIVANIAPYLLFTWGQQRIPAGLAGVLNATTPLFTLLLAMCTRAEAIRPIRITGLVVGFLGVVILSEPWRDTAGYSLPGIGACLLAAGCYAVSYVYARRFLTGRGGSPLAF